MTKIFHVYVIRFRHAVTKKAAFAQRNPHRLPGKPCVYVGSSAFTPPERYENHLKSPTGSKWVKEFGTRLCERLTNRQPTYPTRADAEVAEYALALHLRGKGYGVWTNLPAIPPFYKATRFRVANDAALPHRFAIITAYATTGELWTDEENQRADRRLQKRFERAGMAHTRITGYSPASGHAEPGWAVAMDFEDACSLGRQFKQDAIYWVDDDRLYVSYCDARQAKVPVRALFSERVDVEPASCQDTSMNMKSKIKP